MADRTVKLKIKRQDSPHRPETMRWEEFEVPWQPRMNVISALMEIRKNPVTTKGEKVAPVVWESVCLEEVCGSCTMLVNGRVRQSCTALIDTIAPNGEWIELA
ncbi:MAG TPA: 2Fe-2S iron-sulfur cluster-binding protein, partial [Polyangiaceae bacterium]